MNNKQKKRAVHMTQHLNWKLCSMLTIVIITGIRPGSSIVQRSKCETGEKPRLTYTRDATNEEGTQRGSRHYPKKNENWKTGYATTDNIVMLLPVALSEWKQNWWSTMNRSVHHLYYIVFACSIPWSLLVWEIGASYTRGRLISEYIR